MGDGYFGGDVDDDVDHFYFQVGLALPLDPLPQRSRGVHPGTTQDANPGILSILRINNENCLLAILLQQMVGRSF